MNMKVKYDEPGYDDPAGNKGRRFLRKHVVVHHCTRCGCEKSPLVNINKTDKKSSYVCRFKNKCRKRQQRRWKRG